MKGSPNSFSDHDQDRGGCNSESNSPKPVQQNTATCNGVPSVQIEQTTDFSAHSADQLFGSASALLPPTTSTSPSLANQLAQVRGQCSTEGNSTTQRTASPSSSSYDSLLSAASPKENTPPRARKKVLVRGPNTRNAAELALRTAPPSSTTPALSPVPVLATVTSLYQPARNQRPFDREETTRKEMSTPRRIESPPPDLSPTPMVSAVKGPSSPPTKETPDAWGHHRIRDAGSSESTTSSLLALLENSPEFRSVALPSDYKSRKMRWRESVSSAPFSPAVDSVSPEILLDDSSGGSAPVSPLFATCRVPNEQARFAASTLERLPPHRMKWGSQVTAGPTPKLTVDGAAVKGPTPCAQRRTKKAKSASPSISSLNSVGEPSRHDNAAGRRTQYVVRTPDLSTRDMNIGHRTRGKHTDSHSFNWGGERKEIIIRYMAVVLAVLVFSALLTVMLNFLVPPDRPNLICTTASCEALDALLAGSLNSGREPCDNFYEHICGGWAQVQNVSVYRNHLHDFIREVHGVLATTQVPAHTQTAAQMVAAFYQSCTAVVVDGADQLPTFRAHLERAGLAWPIVLPSSDLALTAAQVYRDFQVTALLRIRRVTRKDAGSLLEIAPDQGFLRAWKKTRGQLLRDGAYKRFYEETRYLYAGNGSLNGREFRYDEFLRTESFILDSLADEELLGNTVVMNNISALPVIMSKITVRSWVMVTEKLVLSPDVAVDIANIEHVSKFDKLLEALGEHYLHYYFGWYVVQQMRRYMNKALADSWYSFAATTLGGEESGERRADCIELVESVVGKLAFESFILSSVDASDEGYVTSMATALSEDLTQKVMVSAARNNRSAGTPLETADFLVVFHGDVIRAVKEALGAKSALINHTSLISNWMDIVGAVSEINTPTRDSVPTTYIHDLSENERYSLFNDRTGTLSVPPLFSMLPVYKRDLTDAAKFGALGTLLATAIMRDFLARLPGDSTFREVTSRGLRCFNDSAELSYINSDFSLPVASVEVAMSVLRALPRSDHLRLRTFDRLQTFFAVMCYLLCAPITSKGSLVAEAICNEAVKNSHTFSLAFECTADSPMNPDVKCHMF